MTNTGFDTHRKDIKRLVTTYVKEGDGLKAIPNALELTSEDKTKVFMAGSGLISTPLDYMKFCHF